MAKPLTNPGIGDIGHVEIPAAEPAKLKQFLEQQFGWKFTTHKMDFGDYNLFRTPNGSGGGVMAPMPGQPVAATPYITVGNIESTSRSVQQAGATILMPVTEVPGQGKFFLFTYAGCPPLACWEQTGPRN